MGPEYWIAASVGATLALLGAGYWVRGIEARAAEAAWERRERALLAQLEAALRHEEGGAQAARIVVGAAQAATRALSGGDPDLVLLAGDDAPPPPGTPSREADDELRLLDEAAPGEVEA